MQKVCENCSRSLDRDETIWETKPESYFCEVCFSNLLEQNSLLLWERWWKIHIDPLRKQALEELQKYLKGD